jgi:hydroxyacylglutathione hydrolase
VIVPLRLGIANAFLVQEERAILVDTGPLGKGEAVVAALRRAGVEMSELALIVQTHAHWDHAGSTRELRAWTRAPVAVHRADVAMLRRGDNGVLRPTCLTGRLLLPLLDRAYPAVEPDIVFEGELDLSPYGVRARLLPTPGHTAGSVSLLTADGEAIVGDLMMGGYFGGKVRRHWPTLHYYAEDLPTLLNSIRALLGWQPKRIHAGHGGPLEPAAVARTFGS